MERGNGNERKYISVKCKFWRFISKLRLRNKLRILEFKYQVSIVTFCFTVYLCYSMLEFVKQY